MAMDVTGPIRKGDASKHWSDTVQEILLSVGVDGPLGVTVLGGAENGQFCWIDSVDTSNVVFYSGKLCRDEIILEIQGQKVAGFTLYDLQDWLVLATSNNNPVLVKTALTGMCWYSTINKFLIHCHHYLRHLPIITCLPS